MNDWQPDIFRTKHLTYVVRGTTCRPGFYTEIIYSYIVYVFFARVLPGNFNTLFIKQSMFNYLSIYLIPHFVNVNMRADGHMLPANCNGQTQSS